MALALQTYTFAHQYVNSWLHYVPRKTENALKLGVLSSATISAVSVIHPVETHPDVVLYAIASRDQATASSFASKYRFRKSFSSYEALLADSEVEIVYIPVPNALHFEWAFKALEAGKHVLLEKPFTSNAREAEELVKKSKETGKILMEAFHWQFHPAAHRFREILDSGEYGKIVRTDAAMTSTPGLPSDDIRWKYELSGGSLMDLTYVLSFTRYALHARIPESVLHAKATPAEHDPRVDSAMQATLMFKVGSESGDSSDVYSTIYADMAREWAYGLIPRIWELPSIRVETEHAEIYFYNAMLPHAYHYIGITDKRVSPLQMRYEKIYKGGPKWGERGETWWSSYRYQLEAFVDKVRGREPVCWVDGQESIMQMRTVDQVYQASGLPLRPTSSMIV
ncbi:hypothetical protein B0H34DRAFT_392617 [Crassisporium funariophilum]|nr:hypothetical protein B0H34DRAFT_392617 [Crassisporium funariophilum]